MSLYDAPLVSILTPVYNGEDFLVECIESILGQSYTNFEYIIVNNCSKDRSLEIALSYAQKDSRVRVHNNQEFVGVIANHNIAFGLISERSKYCKVVSADDFIFPDCVKRMVEFGEANPAAGIIGSYQLSGSYIRWQGFEYPKAVFPGAGVCRRIFLGRDNTFGFGSPTSLIYRSGLVRDSPAFYPNASPHADTSACFRDLKDSDFGFIYEVLSYERIHEATQSTKSADMNRYSSANMSDLIEYGPAYLTKEELEHQLSKLLADYHRFLAVAYFSGRREKAFWDYHKKRLEELRRPLKHSALWGAALRKLLQEALNPQQAVKKVWRRFFPTPTRA